MWSISKRQEWLWQKCAPRTECGLSQKTSSLPPWVAARLMGWVWHNCSSSGGPDWFPSLIQARWPHFPCYSAGYTISSVTQSCPTLCDPMNRSTPGLPVHHQLSESTQTHVHWVSDAIQPSHPLSSSSPALNLSQHQGQLFAWGGQSIGVSASTSVLPMNTQDWSPSRWTGWISLQSQGLSRVFSNTTVWKNHFFSAQPSLWSNSHMHIWLLEKL